MTIPSLIYPPDHWLRSADPELVLQTSRQQQALAYSRIKNILLWELVGEVTGIRFLDFGCGAGFFTVEAARRGAALALGLDALASSLAGGELLARSQGMTARCCFIQAGSLLGLAGEKPFEVILMRDVIEHIPDDISLLTQAAGLLAPGGRLVLATQNARSINYLLEGTIRRLILRERNWMGWDATHVRFYTPTRLTIVLHRAGLRPVAWRSAYLVPHKIPWPQDGSKKYLRLDFLTYLDRVLGRVRPFSRLGWSLMTRAVKI